MTLVVQTESSTAADKRWWERQKVLLICRNVPTRIFAFKHWTVHRLCERRTQERTQAVFISKQWFQTTFIKTDWRYSGNKAISRPCRKKECVRFRQRVVCSTIIRDVSNFKKSSVKLFPLTQKQNSDLKKKVCKLGGQHAVWEFPTLQAEKQITGMINDCNCHV